MEDSMFQAAQVSSDARTDTPAPPQLLSRTQDSVTLTHRPFKLKSRKTAAYFAVYAKNFGAGVGLGMNSTSMELQGTGQHQPLGSRVTISGEPSSCGCLEPQSQPGRIHACMASHLPYQSYE